MRVRIAIYIDGSPEPQEEVELPLPSEPGEDFPGGGHWRWVGPLPRTRVDLPGAHSLAVYVVRRQSTQARNLERYVGAMARRRGVNRVPDVAEEAPAEEAEGPSDVHAPAAKAACPECGGMFQPGSGMGRHRATHAPPGAASGRGSAKLTAAVVAECLAAVYEDPKAEEWATGFRGNRDALRAWVSLARERVDAAEFKRANPERREEMVEAAIIIGGGSARTFGSLSLKTRCAAATAGRRCVGKPGHTGAHEFIAPLRSQA